MSLPSIIQEIGEVESSAVRHRKRWREHFRENPLEGIPADQVHAHFEHMPLSYWTGLRKLDLVWSMEMVGRFLYKTVLDPSNRPCVVVDWSHEPHRGITRVMVCEWDRPGLLAQIAAAFSALQINVKRADVYTRTDNIALDIFEVSELDLDKGVADHKLQELEFFIASGLQEPLGYVISRLSESNERNEGSAEFQSIVQVVDTPGETEVLLRIHALDRLGLLYDIFQTLADLKLNVSRALIDTDGEIVCDRIYVTNRAGGKIHQTKIQREVQRALSRMC